MPTSAKTMAAQRSAITEWRQTRGERFAELKAITQPTLVVNGYNDIMVPTINSFTLSQKISNAQLIVYPPAGRITARILARRDGTSVAGASHRS